MIGTRPGRKALTPYQRLGKWISDGTVIEGPGGCWLWTGHLNDGGYAQTAMSAKAVGDYTPGARYRCTVHRWTYELHIATIPAGLDLDHLCRVRHCVNPWHLEPVTRSVNLKRAVGIGSQWSKRTHCKNGHEYTAENTYRSARDNARVCRQCQRDRNRNRKGRGAA